MKQTYDNYHRYYIKTPNGQAAHNKANRKYRRKLKKLYPTLGINRASRLERGINNMKKRTSLGTVLTQEEFDTIKELQSLKLTSTKTAGIVKRSSSTVWHIYQCATLEEYHVRANAAKATKTVSPNFVRDKLSAIRQACDELEVYVGSTNG